MAKSLGKMRNAHGRDTGLTHIKDLVPDPANRRAHNPRNIGMVVDALQAVGAARSIVIDEDNVILAGNGVSEAAAEAGITKVQVVEVDGSTLVAVRRKGLTAEQKRALAIYDNRTGELATWDFEQLQADVDAGLSLHPFWTPEEEKGLLKTAVKSGLTAPDEVPDARQTDITVGDSFELGSHRLRCGDSTDPASLERFLGQAKPCVLTDPPYGIDIVKASKVGGLEPPTFGGIGGRNIVEAGAYARITNDHSTDTARGFYSTTQAVGLTDLMIWGGNYFSAFLPPSPCWLIWDKENSGNFGDAELAWTSFSRSTRLYRWMWNGMSRKGDRATEGAARMHPTQKPVGLHAEILNEWTREGDLVLDGFAGSGTTLMACEQTSRVCYAFEIEPSYCQVIIDRWQNFTGQKAQKVGEAVRA